MNRACTLAAVASISLLCDCRLSSVAERESSSDAEAAEARALDPVDTPRPPETLEPGAKLVTLPSNIAGDAPPSDLRPFLTDVAPGRLPGDECIAGTVFVARFEACDNLYVTEWDLEQQAIRRKIQVAHFDRRGDVQMVRAGNWLHLLVWNAEGPPRYFRVSTELTLEADELEGVSGRPLGLAADDRLAFGTYEGLISLSESLTWRGGLVGFTYDRPQLHRNDYLQFANAPFRVVTHNAAVIDGQAFVLEAMAPAPDLFKIARLDSTMATEAFVLIHAPHDPTAKGEPTNAMLFAEEGHLRVRTANAPDMIEVTPSLKDVRRVPACTGGAKRTPQGWVSNRDFRLGNEHVRWHSPRWIEWTTYAPPLPPSACPDYP